MNNEAIVSLEKRREICCHSWGIPPWQFDAAMAAGLVTVTQIRWAVSRWLDEHPDKKKAAEWLYPGITEEVKQQQEEEAMARSWQNFPFDEPPA